MFIVILVISGVLAWFTSDTIVRNYSKNNQRKAIEEFKKNPHSVVAQKASEKRNTILATAVYKYKAKEKSRKTNKEEEKEYEYTIRKFFPSREYVFDQTVKLYYALYPSTASLAEDIGTIKKKQPFIFFGLYIAIFVTVEVFRFLTKT